MNGEAQQDAPDDTGSVENYDLQDINRRVEQPSLLDPDNIYWLAHLETVERFWCESNLATTGLKSSRGGRSIILGRGSEKGVFFEKSMLLKMPITVGVYVHYSKYTASALCTQILPDLLLFNTIRGSFLLALTFFPSIVFSFFKISTTSPSTYPGSAFQ